MYLRGFYMVVCIALLSVLSTIASASDDIVLRPGDILYITLPGESDFNKEFPIDRKGQIILPEIGDVVVAGKTIAEARNQLNEDLSLVFRDLRRFDIIIQERKLLVTVLGLVKEPGLVELPEDGTVQLAISNAGGLVAGAQLDRIQVQRQGEPALTVDYKRYLDSGDMSQMPPLNPLDVIFVPASPLLGNVKIDFDAATLSSQGDGGEDRTSVKVFGEVLKPGLFAYKNGADVIDMIMRAGGVTRYAAVEQIRIIDEGEPVPFNLKAYLDTGDTSLLPNLLPGATIYIPIIADDIKSGRSIVYVMGEVAKPGAYENKNTNLFMDILANSGGPTRYAETREMRIIRADGSVENFDMLAFTEGKYFGKPPPTINAGDAIFVPEKKDLHSNSWLKVLPEKSIRIIGAMKKPGRYEWSNEMDFMDIFSQAMGPTDKADLVHIKILPFKGTSNQEPIIFDFESFVARGGQPEELPKLAAGYTIIIPELIDDPNDNKVRWIRQTAEQSIYIFGAVESPGRYTFANYLGFLDILAAAGGPIATADLHKVRISHRNGEHARVSHLNLVQYFETGDESVIPKVVTGDVIYVPTKEKHWLEESAAETVRVLGAVTDPGRYRFDDTMTILDLLAEAGGPTSDAHQRKIIVVNYSCCEDRAKTFDLEEFARTGDFSKLPVLRAGDTVYVPDKSQDNRTVVMELVKDTFSVLSVLTLLGFL